MATSVPVYKLYAIHVSDIGYNMIYGLTKTYNRVDSYNEENGKSKWQRKMEEVLGKGR